MVSHVSCQKTLMFKPCRSGCSSINIFLFSESTKILRFFTNDSTVHRNFARWIPRSQAQMCGSKYESAEFENGNFANFIFDIWKLRASHYFYLWNLCNLRIQKSKLKGFIEQRGSMKFLFVYHSLSHELSWIPAFLRVRGILCF